MGKKKKPCTDKKKKLCKDENCKICSDRSFKNHEMVKYWSSKNGEIKPRDICKNSHKKIWFDCPCCNHVFEIELKWIIQGVWCSYCGNKSLCTDKNCMICHNKSFASHEKAEYWSDRNEFGPRMYFKNSHDKCWFVCPESGHIFETTLNNVTSNENWCPYPCCAEPSRFLCDSTTCDICFNASFAGNELSCFWSYDDNGDITPRHVCNKSNFKYWLVCENLHKFKMGLDNIKEKFWCPECNRYRQEKRCIDYLQQISNNVFIKSYPSFLRISKRVKLELDGFNDEIKLAIEYNGEQHYMYIPHYHDNDINNFHKQQEYDKLKVKLCKENNVFLIVVPYFEPDLEKFIHNKYNEFLSLQK